ncbi:MAG: Ig-like domain-containing protein [Dehalococcoidia bacterium]
MPRLLTVISIVLLLFTFAGSALAQPLTCGFYGTANIDGERVADGTVIKAWINGVKVGQCDETKYPLIEGYEHNYAFTTNDQKDHTGQTVTFTIGPDDLLAEESATWKKGDNIELHLHAESGGTAPPPATLPPPSITLYPSEGIATQVSGEGFTPGKVVSIKVGDSPSGSVVANNDGTFAIVIAAPVQNPGTFTVSARDNAGKSDQATLTVPDIHGEPGVKGDRGAPGPKGEVGPKGDAGGSGMALAALILSILAILGFVLIALRISTYWRRR